MNRKQYVLTVALSMLTGLLGGLVSSWLFVGTPVFAQKTEVADIIRARSFELVDKDGKLRAGLGLSDYGGPSLFLYDKNGKNRAGLGLADGVPILMIRDKDGKTRAGLGLSDDGGPRLELYDKDEKVIWTAP